MSKDGIIGLAIGSWMKCQTEGCEKIFGNGHHSFGKCKNCDLNVCSTNVHPSSTIANPICIKCFDKTLLLLRTKRCDICNNIMEGLSLNDTKHLCLMCIYDSVKKTCLSSNDSKVDDKSTSTHEGSTSTHEGSCYRCGGILDSGNDYCCQGCASPMI